MLIENLTQHTFIDSLYWHAVSVSLHLNERINRLSMDQSQKNPYKSSGGFKRIYFALLNSMNGFKFAYRHESAFRQELFLTMLLVPLAFWVNVTTIERILLISSTLLILIVELLNSSIETAIDRISLERHPLSGRAKDLGSAAVMLALLMCLITWCMILWAHPFN